MTEPEEQKTKLERANMESGRDDVDDEDAPLPERDLAVPRLRAILLCVTLHETPLSGLLVVRSRERFPLQTVLSQHLIPCFVPPLLPRCLPRTTLLLYPYQNSGTALLLKPSFYFRLASSAVDPRPSAPSLHPFLFQAAGRPVGLLASQPSIKREIPPFQFRHSLARFFVCQRSHRTNYVPV